MSKFLKFIVNLVVLCTVVVALALLVPPLAGVKTVMIDDAGKDTNLPVGSVTYGKYIDTADLEKGDKILLENDGAVYEYTVREADSAAGSYTLVDAHDRTAEEQTAELKGEAAKSIVTIPYIAYAAMALQSTEGLIMAGLAIVFLIILFILSELWKDDDDEEDEEDEEDEDIPEEEALPLSRKERKRAAKEAKRAAKAEAKMKKKRAKKGYDDEEDEEADEAEVLVEEEPEQLAEEVIKASLESVAFDISEAADQKEEAPVEKTQEIPSVKAAEEAVAETAEEVVSEPAAEKAVQEPERSEEQDEQDAIVARERILPSQSLDVLISKATVEGDEPDIIEDEEAGVTLLDYSDII